MGRVTLTLPRLGETMEEAKVTEWLIAPGDSYDRGDVMLEVETDKTVVEVPALASGTLLEQLVTPGDMVALDAPIAQVEQEGEAPVPESVKAPAPNAPASTTPVNLTRPEVDRVAASPAARAQARRQGVSLAGVIGTGRRGRITARDIKDGDKDATVVLLHGLFDDSAGWRGLPRRLQKRGLTAVTIDLPGHGADKTSADSFEQAVDLVADRLPAGPLDLVGHSLGAAVAARLAHRIQARAQSLTLFSPAGLGPAISADFVDGMIRADSAAALKETLTLLDAGPMSDAAIAQQFPRYLDGLDARVRLARAVAKEGRQLIDATADIAAAPCPVTVIFGTADRILDWRDVAHLPAETRIHLVPNAGHLPHLVRPDLAAALIAQQHDLAESA